MSKELKVTLNAYQATNLIGLLWRNKKNDNGDWFHEIAELCHDVLAGSTLPESFPGKGGTVVWNCAHNNFDDEIPLDREEFVKWFRDQDPE